MRITNNKGLPAPIYNAILANPYSRGDADISVTDLIDSPRLVALREKHKEDIVVDASDQIWSLMGQAMHTILERSGIKSGKGDTESRLYMPVDDWLVSGQFDYIDEEGVLWDWKFVSVYEYINGIKASRTRQLNLYALLATHAKVSVSGLRVGYIFRDWSPRAAAQDPNYPQAQALELDVYSWSPDERREYLQDRVVIHKAAQKAVAEGQEPEECTADERWAKPDMWAVMKKGNKRATKVLPTQEQADLYAAQDNNLRVEYRAGESTRCKYYCPVLKWCNQGMKEVYGV